MTLVLFCQEEALILYLFLNEHLLLKAGSRGVNETPVEMRIPFGRQIWNLGGNVLYVFSDFSPSPMQFKGLYS